MRTSNLFCLIYVLNDPGNENDVRLLIRGSNVNSLDADGNSALLLAVERGNNW